MITYELAKKLQNCGFPNKIGLIGELRHNSITGDTISVPSLSELIEACGDDFIELEKVEDKWWAKGKWEYCGGGKIPRFDVSDSTPEEAVAKLWLALNENGK